MVYIDSNGRVCERRPWNLNRFIGIFLGVWYICVQFFQTLLAPFRTGNAHANRRNGNGWGSWSGGGGGRGGGGGGGLRPNRNIGRITNSMNCNTPMGGCGCPR